MLLLLLLLHLLCSCCRCFYCCFRCSVAVAFAGAFGPPTVEKPTLPLLTFQNVCTALLVVFAVCDAFDSVCAAFADVFFQVCASAVAAFGASFAAFADPVGPFSVSHRT